MRDIFESFGRGARSKKATDMATANLPTIEVDGDINAVTDSLAGFLRAVIGEGSGINMTVTTPEDFLDQVQPKSNIKMTATSASGERFVLDIRLRGCDDTIRADARLRIMDESRQGFYFDGEEWKHSRLMFVSFGVSGLIKLAPTLAALLSDDRKGIFSLLGKDCAEAVSLLNQSLNESFGRGSRSKKDTDVTDSVHLGIDFGKLHGMKEISEGILEYIRLRCGIGRGVKTTVISSTSVNGRRLTTSLDMNDRGGVLLAIYIEDRNRPKFIPYVDSVRVFTLCEGMGSDNVDLSMTVHYKNVFPLYKQSRKNRNDEQGDKEMFEFDGGKWTRNTFRCEYFRKDSGLLAGLESLGFIFDLLSKGDCDGFIDLVGGIPCRFANKDALAGYFQTLLDEHLSLTESFGRGSRAKKGEDVAAPASLGFDLSAPETMLDGLREYLETKGFVKGIIYPLPSKVSELRAKGEDMLFYSLLPNTNTVRLRRYIFTGDDFCIVDLGLPCFGDSVDDADGLWSIEPEITVGLSTSSQSLKRTLLSYPTIVNHKVLKVETRLPKEDILGYVMSIVGLLEDDSAFVEDVRRRFSNPSYCRLCNVKKIFSEYLGTKTLDESFGRGSRVKKGEDVVSTVGLGFDLTTFVTLRNSLREYLEARGFEEVEEDMVSEFRSVLRGRKGKELAFYQVGKYGLGVDLWRFIPNGDDFLELYVNSPRFVCNKGLYSEEFRGWLCGVFVGLSPSVLRHGRQNEISLPPVVSGSLLREHTPVLSKQEIADYLVSLIRLMEDGSDFVEDVRQKFSHSSSISRLVSGKIIRKHFGAVALTESFARGSRGKKGTDATDGVDIVSASIPDTNDLGEVVDWLKVAKSDAFDADSSVRTRLVDRSIHTADWYGLKLVFERKFAFYAADSELLLSLRLTGSSGNLDVPPVDMSPSLHVGFEYSYKDRFGYRESFSEDFELDLGLVGLDIDDLCARRQGGQVDYSAFSSERLIRLVFIILSVLDDESLGERLEPVVAVLRTGDDDAKTSVLESVNEVLSEVIGSSLIDKLLCESFARGSRG